MNRLPLLSYNPGQPRNSSAITSRRVLAKALGIEKIVRKYHDDNPKTVTLDAVVFHLLDRAAVSPAMPRSMAASTAKNKADKGLAKAQWVDSDASRYRERILVAPKLDSARIERLVRGGHLKKRL